MNKIALFPYFEIISIFHPRSLEIMILKRSSIIKLWRIIPYMVL